MTDYNFDLILEQYRKTHSRRLSHRVYKDELEFLETPGLPLETQFQVVDELSRLNRRSGYTQIFLNLLQSLVKSPSPNSSTAKIKILDIGIGGGGLLEAIHRWAKRKRTPVELWGLDLSENFIRETRKRLEAKNISAHFIHANACDLKEIQDHSFDFVVCSYMVHHIRKAGQVARFLKEVYRISKQGWLIVDLNRTFYGPLFVGIGGSLFGRSKIVVEDGIKSVRRAYTTGEINLILKNLKQIGNKMICESLPVVPYWMIKGKKALLETKR